ncbi:MAG: hypothetical protein ACREQ4_05550 [Candidatus Binataceae bacterium]
MKHYTVEEINFLTADGAQVSKYWKEYRQVLVTNFRDFLLAGADAEGKPVKLGYYRLAANETAFWTVASHPRPVAAEKGQAFRVAPAASSGERAPDNMNSPEQQNQSGGCHEVREGSLLVGRAPS